MLYWRVGVKRKTRYLFEADIQMQYGIGIEGEVLLKMYMKYIFKTSNNTKRRKEN